MCFCQWHRSLWRAKRTKGGVEEMIKYWNLRSARIRCHEFALNWLCTHCEVLHANCEKMKNIIIDMKLRAGVKNKLWAEVLELLKYIYFDIWHIRSLPCSRTHSSVKWNAASSRWRISAINSPNKILCEKIPLRMGTRRGKISASHIVFISVRRTCSANAKR